MAIAPALLSQLAGFPAALAAAFALVPRDRLGFAPDSWEGSPGETFTPLEHVCHVRDIEADGYRHRFARALAEERPILPSLDGYALAAERRYREADPQAALEAFARARRETVEALARLDHRALARTALFEDRVLTVNALAHVLCSHDQQHLSCLHWLMSRM